jgi:hypothetical protein
MNILFAGKNLSISKIAVRLSQFQPHDIATAKFDITGSSRNQMRTFAPGYSTCLLSKQMINVSVLPSLRYSEPFIVDIPRPRPEVLPRLFHNVIRAQIVVHTPRNVRQRSSKPEYWSW